MRRTTDRIIRLKQLPRPLHTGAVRSYTVTSPFGRFTITLMRKVHTAAKDAWLLEDRATGAIQRTWTLSEALSTVDLLLTCPTWGQDRFCVLERPTDPVWGYDCVLYDRLSKRWWPRKNDLRLLADIRLMEQIAEAGVLPDSLTTPQSVAFPAPPDEWREPTSTKAGKAGRAQIERARSFVGHM